MARRLAAAGAAALLAGVAAGPAHAVAQPAGAAAERQQTVPGTQAARSTKVTLTNRTPLAWTRWEASLVHGMWYPEPPATIAADSSGTWQSESNGVLTGTEGLAVFGTQHGPVEIYWNNPYFGSNKYGCRAPSGYSCRQTGGPGNNASVTFEVGWL
ncbi:hypothetical protein AB0D66_28075 [Streptomyces sp. NPDC048270]|uniref:hypothetical protein n=1 Tax=Streptomyces sp. NPDC048270 TaxID=3154615 RepID=UPI0034080D26